MFAVVQLHDPPRNVRLERGILECELRQAVLVHVAVLLFIAVL
jgi:hypothetical protein